MRFTQRGLDPLRETMRFAALLVLVGALGLLVPGGASAGENLILEASGSFDAVPGLAGQPGMAFYDVGIPSRGRFRGEVVGSPALFGGPDGNNPDYHFSSLFASVGPTPLRNFVSTDIEVAPITTNASALIELGGSYQAKVVGPQKISFTFGDFIGGDAQGFTARGFFDPSPVADAGPNLALESGAGGMLLGSGSDVDADPLTYTWVRLLGPDLNLSDPTAAHPTIQAPVVTAATTTRMQLVVSDANSQSLPDTVDVALYPTGGNIPPLVDPGPGSTGTFDSLIMLDGSNSYDLDGTVVLYSWSQTSGPRVALSDPTSPTPTFKQFEPESFDVTYEFELVVSDGRDLSAPDTVQVIIEGYGNGPVPVSPRETLLASDAGAVPEVTQISGDPPESVDFPNIPVPGTGRLRTEVLGSPGLFGGPDGNNPNFHLSSHGARWNGFSTLGFLQTDIETPPVITNTFFKIGAGGAATLNVIGPQALSFTFLDFLFGRAQSFDVNVWFRPVGEPPVADAGTLPHLQANRVRQLNGLGSSDPDGDPLSYQWTQHVGPLGTLSNSHSPVPLYKVPALNEPTTIGFTLVVSDGEESSPASVVPEPASWLLQLVALATVARLGRFRRRRWISLAAGTGRESPDRREITP